MSENWSDDRLDDILASVGANLETPSELAPEDRSIGRSSGARTRRRWVAAGIAAALLVIGLAASPLRDTVADWFDLDDDRKSDQPQPEPKLPPEKAKPKR